MTSFFGAETTKGASFDEKAGYGRGTVWSGVIVNIGERKRAMSYVKPGSGKTPEPLSYPSGDPIYELPITIQAEQVQPTVDDDGKRVIYFGGEKRKALGAALRAAQAKRDPVEGDWIALQWSGGSGDTGDRKTYTAQWRPGQQTAGGFFTEQPAQQQVAPVQQFAPQAQPAQFVQPVPQQVIPQAAPPVAPPWQQPQVIQGQPVPAGQGPI